MAIFVKNICTIFSRFSPQFGEIVFWWARGENSWAPPKFPPPPPPNQTLLPTIFLSFFSILPISPPTKHTLDVYVENTKRYLLSNKALGTIDIKSLKGKCVNKSYTCTKFPKSATNLQS